MPDPAQRPSADVRRARILEAARRAFDADGTLDVGLRRIASEAGYTTGAIYKLFSGKEDIYAALLDQSLRDCADTAAAAAGREADPRAALRAACLAVISYYQTHKFEYELGLYLFDRDGPKGLGTERDARLNALLDEALSVFATCFQRLGGSDMTADRARDMAHALFAALAGLLALSFSARDRSLRTSWQKILDTTLRAFVADAIG